MIVSKACSCCFPIFPGLLGPSTTVSGYDIRGTELGMKPFVFVNLCPGFRQKKMAGSFLTLLLSFHQFTNPGYIQVAFFVFPKMAQLKFFKVIHSITDYFKNTIISLIQEEQFAEVIVQNSRFYPIHACQ